MYDMYVLSCCSINSRNAVVIHGLAHLPAAGCCILESLQGLNKDFRNTGDESKAPSAPLQKAMWKTSDILIILSIKEAMFKDDSSDRGPEIMKTHCRMFSVGFNHHLHFIGGNYE